MKKRFSLCLALSLAIPYAVAEEAKETRHMSFVYEWAGPFKDTTIVKTADYSDGVVCYIYAPKTVSYNWGTDGISYGNNNIGSISCVKVAETSSASRKK